MQWLHSTGFLIATVAAVVLAGCQRSSPPTSPSPSSPTPSPLDPSASVTVSPPASAQTQLWSQLRQGKGYVILFRHALAPGTGDPAGFRLDDCTTQRNLSEEGRQQAVRMGEVLRQQQIVVSRVLSSQWCRCLETARLMNVGSVEAFPALNSFFQDRSTEVTQTEQLRQFILENQNNSGVIILVTHQVNIIAISDIVPQSGGAVIMRATAPDQIERVGQLDPL